MGWETKDPVKGELVYVGTMARLVRFVKLFSITTSLMGIAVQPLIYNQVADLHWALALSLGGVTSFFIFITPLLLHIVTKRYVTHIYWHSDVDRFNAVTYSFLLRQLDHKFTSKEVISPSRPGLFTTVLVNGGKTPLFIDPSLFINKKAFVHLMKYNEPLDWEIPESTQGSDEGKESYEQKERKTVQKH